MRNLTAEAQRRGEEPDTILTTETRRHGGESGHLSIGQTANICHPERHRATQERSRVEGPRASIHCYTAAGGSHITVGLLDRFQNIWHTARAVLREIFDESSYERFL